MPFFLPGRLINLEYFSGEPDPDYDRIAKPYQKEIDFAFFAANFGYSKGDYESLTRRERAFLYKAWEDREVFRTTMLYNAVYTATYNVNRKKNKRALKLWRRGQVQMADKEIAEENLKIALEVEEKEGKNWVNLVYQKNGLKKPERRGHG